MCASEQPQAAFAVSECFAVIEGGLRAMLHAHHAPVGSTTLNYLRTLAELSTTNAIELRRAAQSLLGFLEYRMSKVPMTCDRNQIVLLLDNLRRQIYHWASDTRKEPSLPRKSSLAGQPLGLFLDSSATALLLKEVITTSGHCVENICGLANVVVHAQNDFLLTIITDLSMLRDDPQARDHIRQLRKMHPKAQMFCLSSATHFAARLEAVRLGASRFLIKPLDVGQLSTLLAGIGARQDSQPFRALLVDDGRALAALHAHATRASSLAAGACSVALYPEVMIRDAYMAGCKGLQPAAALYAAVPSVKSTDECLAR